MYSIGIEEEYFVFDARTRRAVRRTDKKYEAAQVQSREVDPAEVAPVEHNGFCSFGDECFKLWARDGLARDHRVVWHR